MQVCNSRARGLFATRFTASGVALAAAAAFSSCGGGGGSPGGGNTALVTLTTTVAADGTTGIDYSQTFQALFPHSPGIFVVTGGSIPPGLTLNQTTGELSGPPRQTGAFQFEIAARDGTDGNIPQGRDASFSEDRRVFRIDIDLGDPRILPQILPAAQYRASYGYQIDVAGGTAPYTFSKTGGTLPNGVTVSSTGFIGNFPTQAQTAPYVFDVQVVDGLGEIGTATLSLPVIVLPLIILTSNPIQEAAIGFPYSVQMTLASGGGGVPYSWNQAPLGVGETALNSIGMMISGSGILSDTGAGPTALGTYSFTISVTDEAGQIATRQLTLKVNPGPVLTNITPNRSSTPGPYTATGLNFQPGVRLLFKPGLGQSIVVPTFVNSTTLTFPSPVPAPASGAGAVDVRVLNPDNGGFTKPTAFIFPAATLSFGTKGFVPSALSSTGIDAKDVNGDGKADVVHCGASGMSTYAGSIVSTTGGVIYHRNLGTTPVTFASQTLSVGNFTDVKFADVNTDGTLDIVALGQSTIQVWLNGVNPNPLGTFSASALVSTLNVGGTPVTWPTDLAIGKLNSDSIPDLAYGAQFYASGGYSSGRCFTMAGTGTGTFTVLDAAITTMVSAPQASYTMGIHTVQCTDLNNDGRSEVVAGTGMGYYNGTYPGFLNSVGSSGLFSSWTQIGQATASPQYPGTQGLAVGDFLGNGGTQAIVAVTGATNYSNLSAIFLLSGSSLGSTTALPTPSTGKLKAMCAVDLDFDLKLDWAVATNPSGIAVYRGSTQAIVASLDAASGSPSVGSPKTGRLVGADLDGDGKPDMISTTSYWAGEGMAGNFGATYFLGLNGDGGDRGFVFFLNTSN